MLFGLQRSIQVCEPIFYTIPLRCICTIPATEERIDKITSAKLYTLQLHIEQQQFYARFISDSVQRSESVSSCKKVGKATSQSQRCQRLQTHCLCAAKSVHHSAWYVVLGNRTQMRGNHFHVLNSSKRIYLWRGGLLVKSSLRTAMKQKSCFILGCNCVRNITLEAVQ